MEKKIKRWRVFLSVLLIAVIILGTVNHHIAKAAPDSVNSSKADVATGSGITDSNNTDGNVTDNNTIDDDITDSNIINDNTDTGDLPGNLDGEEFDASTGTNVNGTDINIVSGNTYKIVSALDSSFVWRVRDKSYYNGRNMQLYKDDGTNSQKFVFIKQKNGFFKIRSTNSSKMLESDRENNKEGANVCQYDNNNAENQLWKLVPTEDGCFYLENKSNGLVAGINGSKAANNANIQMYSATQADSQKFKLVSTAPFANATYKIVSALNNNYVWHVKYGSYDDGATIHLYKDDNYINTPKFVFTRQKDGYYIIENTNSARTVECKGAGKKSGTDICQNSRNNSVEQQWKLVPTEDGYYYLQNRCNNLVASVAGGKAGNNVNIEMSALNKTANQKFQIMVTFPLANGTYVLESALNRSYVWDISGASKADKGNLQLYEYYGNNAQKFVVKKHYGEWEYYTIQNVNSGKVIECNSKKQKNGTNIWQYSASQNTDTAQLWKPVWCGSGYNYLQNWYTGLVAGVNGGKAANRANIQMYKQVSNKGLRFKFADPAKKKAKSKYPDGLLYPLKGKITRSSSVKTEGYYCDYVAAEKTPVYAPADGTVEFIQSVATKYKNRKLQTLKLASYGNYIKFTSTDKKYTVKCAHLSSFKGATLAYKLSHRYPCGVSDGYKCEPKSRGKVKVKKGDLIGYTGKTGNASGPHIHIEVTKNGKAVDPVKTFTTWK